MLISLRIQDFVLIDHTTTAFRPGLNVMTGETGSGKSAVIDALNQVLGARADSSLIRNGQEKAIVEALFDISNLPSIPPLLESMGFSVDPTHLHIKREIAKDGKGRIWINREPAPLASIKTLAPLLMEFVGQRANKDLFEAENHLEILDAIGGLVPFKEAFKDVHSRHLKKERELKELLLQKSDLAKNKTKVAEDLKEIESVSPIKEEEETLFEEYSLLSNVEELREGLLAIVNSLSGEGVLHGLSVVKKKTEEFLKIDESLHDPLSMTKEAIANMKEVERFIESKLSNLEANPERLSYLDDRLKRLSRLKKLFGPTMDDVIAKWAELQRASSTFENEDERENQLREEIRLLKNQADLFSQDLRKKRKLFSQEFASKVTSILKTLNMPNALFTVSFQEKATSEKGNDLVEFFLSPNLGENAVSVSKSVSGGELSRVLLAIKLQEQENKATIIFDEIDANIGGNTAVLVGEKLKELSFRKQVILITHFPQVARFACHHIKISKKETEGRTFTEIESLDKSAQEHELLRMSGGDFF